MRDDTQVADRRLSSMNKAMPEARLMYFYSEKIGFRLFCCRVYQALAIAKTDLQDPWC